MIIIFPLTLFVAYVSYHLLTTPSRPKYGHEYQEIWKRQMGWSGETGWRDEDIIIPPMTEAEIDEVVRYYENKEWKG